MEPQPQQPSPWPVAIDAKRLQVLVIILATAWIYWPVLNGGWLWDDDVDITQNGIIHAGNGLTTIWLRPGSQLDYYPVKASVQWLQWHLWGMHTFGYHLTNIILHIVGALLVWRLLDKLGLRLAWLGGLLFAVHPTAVESVAWITELKNTLSLPPFLLAMIVYLNYDEHGRSRDFQLAWRWFLVAMLCKTTMVMFPVVILLYAWWKRGRIVVSDLNNSASFFIISLALGLMTLFVGTWYHRLNHASVEVAPVGGFFSHLALAGLSSVFYFWHVIWPVELLPIYPQWKIDPPSLEQFLTWPILIGLILVLWTQRNAWGRPILFGLGFFLINLLPFSIFNVGGFTNFTWVMDHFLYIPIIGLIGLVVAGLGQITERVTPTLRVCGTALLSIVLVLLTLESHSYAEKFTSQESLWSYEVLHNPNSWIAHNNLGRALMDRGQVAEGTEHFEQALQLKQDYPEAHNNLGIALAQTGHLSQAYDQFNEALRLQPDYHDAHYNLGIAYCMGGRYADAIQQDQEVLRIDPGNATAHNDWGVALARQGRISDAIEQFKEALRLDPRNVDASKNLEGFEKELDNRSSQ